MNNDTHVKTGTFCPVCFNALERLIETGLVFCSSAENVCGYEVDEFNLLPPLNADERECKQINMELALIKNSINRALNLSTNKTNNDRIIKTVKSFIKKNKG